jgi:hypothetical protein
MIKKTKKYTEAELITQFNLKRVLGNDSPLMQEWLNASISLNAGEQYLFDMIWTDAVNQIDGWQEEDLKMQFIAFVLKLGNLTPHEKYQPYFERVVSATVENCFLKVKTDFMLAKGVLDMPQLPFFHFQQYKRQTDPNGSPIAQVLEAMLIAQALNQNNKPIYGAYVIGKFWNFIILQDKSYFISKSYDGTEKEELLQIIAILRKFTEILETRLLE